MGVVSGHYGSVGECDAVLGCYTVLGMDVAEEVEMGVDFDDFGKELFVAVVYVVVEVEDAVGRTVGYQNIDVRGYFGDVTLLAVGDAVTHKHRYSVEFYAINFHCGVAEIVYVWVKSVNISSIETVIVVAADEYLVGVGQVAEPI